MLMRITHGIKDKKKPIKKKKVLKPQHAHSKHKLEKPEKVVRKKPAIDPQIELY